MYQEVTRYLKTSNNNHVINIRSPIVHYAFFCLLVFLYHRLSTWSKLLKIWFQEILRPSSLWTIFLMLNFTIPSYKKPNKALNFLENSAYIALMNLSSMFLQIQQQIIPQRSIKGRHVKSLTSDSKSFHCEMYSIIVAFHRKIKIKFIFSSNFLLSSP